MLPAVRIRAYPAAGLMLTIPGEKMRCRNATDLAADFCGDRSLNAAFGHRLRRLAALTGSRPALAAKSSAAKFVPVLAPPPDRRG